MRTRSSLITGAALSCLLAVMGCGSEDDPATVPGSDGSDGNQDGNVGDGDGDGTPDDGSDGDTDGTPTDGTDGTPTDGTDGTPTDGADGTPGVCEENTNYVGQLFEKDNAPHNGGMETDEAYAATYDAGITAVVAAKPMAESETATVDLALTEATVVATTFDRFANQTFWLQDGKGAVRVALTADTPFTIVVGSKVSAKVTSVKNSFGEPHITGATDWSVVSVDQPVFLDDRTGKDIELADLGKLVRVTGVVSPRACGGDNEASCFTLSHGDKTVNYFSSKDPNVKAGDCITFVGPVSSFDGVQQLGGPNWDWRWVNQ